MRSSGANVEVGPQFVALAAAARAPRRAARCRSGRACRRASTSSRASRRCRRSGSRPPRRRSARTAGASRLMLGTISCAIRQGECATPGQHEGVLHVDDDQRGLRGGSRSSWTCSRPWRAMTRSTTDCGMAILCIARSTAPGSNYAARTGSGQPLGACDNRGGPCPPDLSAKSSPIGGGFATVNRLDKQRGSLLKLKLDTKAEGRECP